MSVTDGNITGDLSEMTVKIEGTVTTVPSGGSSAVSITQGGQTANIAVPGPNLGAGLVVTTGSLIEATSLTNASATGAGAAADFGSGKQHITLCIVAGAGVSAGAVALEVSQNSINWFQATPVSLTAPGVSQVTQVGAWRHARANITTAITGGTVSAHLMAA